MSTDAMLVLEDGSCFGGRYFTARLEAAGEVVFNTSMSGYQEVLTDPSYHRQIVVMTAPQMGNVGVNVHDVESRRVQVAGFVVRDVSRVGSNFRSQGMLSEYLTENRVPGIEAVDTRAVTRRIRIYGAMRGMIAGTERNRDEVLSQVRSLPNMSGLDLTGPVSAKAAFNWQRGFESGFDRPFQKTPQPSLPVAVIDYGIKENILRCLREAGLSPRVFPAATSAEEILKSGAKGACLSNGPGDPAAVTYAFATIRALAEKVPLFGICLGHQLLALALGGRTYKMKFGHRGANQPVRHLASGRTEITSQNHGFAVDPESLPEGLEVSHINLNDHTVEGLRHRQMPLFSVQYHPESSPGPHDSAYLFFEFRTNVEKAAS